MPAPILFTNAALVEGASDHPLPGFSVLVEGDVIREVSDKPIKSGKAKVVDLAGKVLMPGLIDCHVHVVASLADLGRNAALPDSLAAARSGLIMQAMLARGFTTVRDVGGADFGLTQAVAEGALTGPRLVISGKALSQTGGHADFRGRYDDRPAPATGHRLGALGRIADGIDEVRRAAREELKGGAHFIKIMANGGIASPTDPIAYLQYSREEITAIVEEARNFGTYVAAHLYTDDAIRRAVECGVRSIEHCNLVAPDTAALMAENGAIAVPTLVTYESLATEGAKLGFPPASVAKIEAVRSAGVASLEILRAAGVQMAYGSDLLGPMHRHQSEEFVIRGRVLPAREVIASATFVAAELLNMGGKIGSIEAGAYADLIVLDGDPLKDLSLLTRQGRHMLAIMQGGRFVKNRLRG